MYRLSVTRSGANPVSRTDIRAVLIALFTILAGTLCFPVRAQNVNEWTWINGSNVGDQTGLYSTMGTPAAGNVPGARNGATRWTDSNGNLWMFGGAGFDANGTTGLLNDLWEFNPSTNLWTWVKGSSVVGPNCIVGVSPQWTSRQYCGTAGVYGVSLVPGRPDPYQPGGRYGASSWTDSNGNLWLFGGYGFDSNGGLGALNDLWKFIPSANQWFWISGSNSIQPVSFLDLEWLNESGISYRFIGQPGVYGAQGTPDSANGPGGRFGAASWIDGGGNLVLFGGYGFDVEDGMGELNDFWKFNPSTNEWTWVGGSSSLIAMNSGGYLGRPGVGGTLGSPGVSNIPGGRHGASSWIDSNGSLWLFGGWGFDVSGNVGVSNDLWKFDHSLNQWTWMGGYSAGNCAILGPSGGLYCAIPPVYGSLRTPAVGNNPGSREGATSWTDSSGNLWLFGGYTNIIGVLGTNSPNSFNDLWEFNPSANEWTWMGGSSAAVPPCRVCGQPGVYGTLGTPAAENTPGSRSLSVSWSDANGNLWLLGGFGYDSASYLSSLNDLWKYPTLESTADIPTFSLPAGSYASTQTVTINDATAGTTIYYTTDGTTPTTSSTPYIQPITVAHTETLEAIAVANGYTASSVATAAYTITVPYVSLSPSSLTFSSQDVGSTSAAQTVTLTNSGSAQLAITEIIASGDYSTSNNCTATVGAGGSCTIAVTFTPVASGTRTGILTIIDNAGGSPQTVSLSGTGAAVSPAAPAVTLSQTSLNFTSQADGSTSAAQTITLTNSGIAPLSISSITGSGNFVETNSCLNIVAVGANCTISVTFTPASSGTLTGAITITDNAPNSPQTVALSGTGSTVTITPPSTGLTVSSAGSSTTASIQLGSSGGFSGTVNLTCSVAWQGTGAATDLPTCSMSPTQAQVSSSAASNVTLTVNTTGSSSAKLSGALGEGTALAALAVLVLLPRRRWRGLALLLFVGFAATTALTACGGNGSNSGSSGVGSGQNSGTTLGNYTVTVTATSNKDTATATIPLTVQ